MRAPTGVVIGIKNGFCKIKLDTGAVINVARTDLKYGQRITVGLDVTNETFHRIIDDIGDVMLNDQELNEWADWEDDITE